MRHFSDYRTWGDPSQRKAGWFANVGFIQNPDQRHLAFDFDIFDDFKYQRFVLSASCIILYWQFKAHLVHIGVDDKESD